MRTSDFLAAIPDDRPLNRITIPGSHDAGVYVGSAHTMGPSANAWAVCQHGGLMDQCRAGSRFFDIRVIEHGGSIVAHHSNKVVGKRMGSTGGALQTMLGEIMAFLDARPSEFVIARFSKSKPEKQVVQTVIDVCDARLMKGGGNLAKQSLGDLRGKVIAIFDVESFGDHVKAGAGIQPFFKYPDVQNHGLSLCGKYANNNNIVQVYLDQIEKLQAHDRHVGDHLNVTYWTQTSPKVFSKQRNVQAMAEAGQEEEDDRRGDGGDARPARQPQQRRCHRLRDQQEADPSGQAAAQAGSGAAADPAQHRHVRLRERGLQRADRRVELAAPAFRSGLSGGRSPCSTMTA